jgi:hypothetical protein
MRLLQLINQSERTIHSKRKLVNECVDGGIYDIYEYMLMK